MSIAVEEWIKTMEQKEGRRPSPEGIRMVECLDRLGESFEIKGKKDAQQGLSPMTEKAFAKLSAEWFPKDPRGAELVAGLMRSYYMDGYRKGGAVV